MTKSTKLKRSLYIQQTADIFCGVHLIEYEYSNIRIIPKLSDVYTENFKWPL